MARVKKLGPLDNLIIDLRAFTLAMAAYNLIRMPRLLAAA